MSIDGLERDIPDTAANAAEFRVPRHGGRVLPRGVSQGQGGDNRECASHEPMLAAIGPCTFNDSGEQSLARELYPRLEEDRCAQVGADC